MEKQKSQATVDDLGPTQRNRANNSSSSDVSSNHNNRSEPHLPTSSKRKRKRTASMIRAEVASRELKSSSNSSTHLDDNFPPRDMAYTRSLQTARIRAHELKQWLLVSVQTDNLESQELNREVWSNKEVQKLLRRRFLLWRLDADTIEGRRFISFYQCQLVPCICILDPRTGEEVCKFQQAKESKLLPDIKKFLREHKDFRQEISDDSPTTSKPLNVVITTDYDADREDNNTDL